MKIYSNRILLTGLLLGLFTWGISPGVWAKEQSNVKSEFENTGFDDSVSASIKSSFKDFKSKLDIRCSGMDDNKTYTLYVDDLPKAEFESRKGKAKITFASAASRKALALDFDPRGRRLVINDGSDDVLSTVFNNEGDSSSTVVKESTSLTPTSFAPGGSGSASYKSSRGRSGFKVEIEDVPAGDYELYVDSVLRGTITVGSTGRGALEFDSTASPPKLPLTFDPRNKTIDVVQAGNVFFTGTMQAKIGGVNSCTPSDSEEALTSTGADADASGTAKFRVDGDCDRHFSVEVEDLPVGDYDLFVAGVLSGTISVISTNGGTEGEIEFSSGSDDVDELTLTFDPRGALIEVKQGATTFFSSTFTGMGGGGGGVCSVVDTEVALLNQGVIGSAKGKARFRQDSDCRQDLRVEIEDVPLGDYTLRVGGINRGTITVVNVGGENVGEIEFSNPIEPGKELLDFDPQGQLIEVLQGVTPILSRTFPE